MSHGKNEFLVNLASVRAADRGRVWWQRATYRRTAEARGEKSEQEPQKEEQDGN